MRYAAACGLVCWGDKAVHVAGCSVLAMGGSRVISVLSLKISISVRLFVARVCVRVCAYLT